MIDGYLVNYLLLAFLVAYPLSRFATGRLIGILQRHAVLDRPNDRSSHRRPVPRGGGLVVIGLLVVAWGHFGVLVPSVAPSLFTILGLAVALGLVSWIDDLHGLAPFLRLLAQAVAVIGGLWALPHGAVFQGLLPAWLESAAVVLLWLWFVNLFNFMDGIDGITGAQTVAIGLGIVLVAAFANLGPDIALYGATLAAVTLGFLRWNWQPARIFLGDVGSVPLGYMIGWVLLTMAAEGEWVSAIILPLYYLADATITLFRRLLRGEKVWRAHRSHFYQLATQASGTHAGAVRRINATNVALVLLATLAAANPDAAPLLLSLAVAVVALLLWLFAARPIAAPNSDMPSDRD